MKNARRLLAARRTAAIQPFVVMDVLARAQQLEAAGRRVIHMEFGEPDFTAAPQVVAAAVRALRDGRSAYTATLGLPALRETIAAHYESCFSEKIIPDRIAVTAGASGGLLLTLALYVNPGDEFPAHAGDGARGLGAPDAGLAAWLAVQSDRHSYREGGIGENRALHRGAPRRADRRRDLPGSDVSGRSGRRSARYRARPAGRSRDREQFLFEKLAQHLFICAPSVAQHAALACFLPSTLKILEQRRMEFRRRRDFLVPALARAGLHVPARPTGA